MSTLPAPDVTQATRLDNGFIYVRYIVNVSGTSAIYFDLRTQNSVWKQATAVTNPANINGQYTVTSWAGTALNPNETYWVRVRQGLTSGQPVPPSNEVRVNPATIPAVIVGAVTREGPTIVVNYEVPTGYAFSQLFFDLKTSTTQWKQATATSSTSGQFKITSWAGAALDPLQTYWVRIRATHPSGRTVPPSNEKQTPTWSVDALSITAVERTGATTVKVTYTGLQPNAKIIPEIRADGSSDNFAPVASPSVTAAAGSFTITVPKGEVAYAVRLSQIQHGVTSKTTSPSVAPAWWKKPPGVNIGTTSRTLEGRITIPFTGDPTAGEPWTSITVRWLPSGETNWRTITLGGTARTVTFDAPPAKSIEVEIVTNNAAGSSNPSRVTVPASLTAPGVLGAPTATVNPITGVVTLTWVLPNTTPDNAPKAVAVERIVTAPDGRQTFTTIRTVPAPGVTTTDNPPPNSLVSYRVTAQNSAGSSATPSNATAVFATVPFGATRLTAARSGMDAALSWAAPSNTIATSWEIEHTASLLGQDAPDHDWFPVLTPTGTARTALHKSLGPTSHTWRIRPTHNLLTEGVTAPWTYSLTMGADAPPLAPTQEQPTPLDATEAITLPFVHNTVDGSVQSYAHVRYRKYGTTGWTNRYPGTATFATIPANTFVNGDVIEWQVATKGKHPDLGTYAAATFTTRARPTVGIEWPTTGTTVTSSPVTVTYSPSSTAREVALSLYLNDELQAVEANPSHVTQVEFDVEDYGTYRLEAQAWDGQQYSMVTSVTFDVEMTRPDEPTLTAEVEDALRVTLRAHSAATGLPADAMEILFSTDLNTWTSLGLAGAGFTLTDYTPPFNRTVYYKARARLLDGGWRDSAPVAVVVKSMLIAVDWTDEFGSNTVTGECDPAYNYDKPARMVTAKRYAGDDADTHYYRSKTPLNISSSFSVYAPVDPSCGFEPDKSLTDWMRAVGHPGTVTYRDPYGQVAKGSLVGSVVWSADSSQLAQVSFTFAEGRAG